MDQRRPSSVLSNRQAQLNQAAHIFTAKIPCVTKARLLAEIQRKAANKDGARPMSANRKKAIFDWRTTSGIRLINNPPKIGSEGVAQVKKGLEFGVRTSTAVRRNIVLRDRSKEVARCDKEVNGFKYCFTLIEMRKGRCLECLNPLNSRIAQRFNR